MRRDDGASRRGRFRIDTFHCFGDVGALMLVLDVS